LFGSANQITAKKGAIQKKKSREQTDWANSAGNEKSQLPRKRLFKKRTNPQNENNPKVAGKTKRCEKNLDSPAEAHAASHTKKCERISSPAQAQA
jgi:hypothetical protein